MIEILYLNVLSFKKEALLQKFKKPKKKYKIQKTQKKSKKPKKPKKSKKNITSPKKIKSKKINYQTKFFFVKVF